MKLVVEQPAARWYKTEMGLADGDAVRIYVRLGGCGSVHPGLSLGVNKDVPRTIGLSDTVDGVTFYIEEDNLWYLDNRTLTISFDERYEEINMSVW
ncbi:HesB/YadR/YfhF family protein [Paenibacillus sp. N4]|uniref:HesB/YadR/YfhF family protein n=1 Tax=Paenibacillus vietnamensis TaxID=2590547 RepID=UPI001CD0E055|nr:HesB/YadR/YfhF family protein [Paenibacillus vietnamensis]MCA0755993.1 HesB/YadR/YfhF family protein [Paenibacillus vietnamensis]